jgi:hypothetical protein
MDNGIPEDAPTRGLLDEVQAAVAAEAAGQAATAAERKKPPLFKEVQRFLWWVLLPVGIVTAVIWWTFIKQVVLGQPVGKTPIPDWLAWIFAMVFGLGFPALGYAMRLITEVRPGTLVVRLSPFRTLRIPLEYLQDAQVREYSAAREYGGYGVRRGWLGLNIGTRSRNGWAYTARGRRGVQLVLVNGLRIMVGSQQPEDLLRALRQAGGEFGPKPAAKKKRTVKS